MPLVEYPTECKGCGACCYGLFVHVETEEEREKIPFEMLTTDDKGKVVMRQRPEDKSCVALDRETGLCTIYEQRPLACREHLVIGSASNCNVNSTEQPELVQMPLSILDALAHLTGELEQTTIDVIILPFAFAWGHDNREYFQHTWPASELVRRFINILTTRNSRHNNNAKPQKTDNA